MKQSIAILGEYQPTSETHIATNTAIANKSLSNRSTIESFMSNKNQKIKLSLGRKSDARNIANLRYKAIHEIASSDYPEKILNAWGRSLSKEELAKREENFNQRIKQENIIVVAEIDGKLAGFGEVSLPENELTALYVNPDFKRQGVGTAIVKDLESRANQSGLKYLKLHSSLTAELFYKQNGFQKEKEGTHILATGEQMACVIMKKHIANN